MPNKQEFTISGHFLVSTARTMNMKYTLTESHRAKLPDFKTVVTIPVQAVEKE